VSEKEPKVAVVQTLCCQKTEPTSENGISRRLPIIIIVEHPAELFLTSDVSHLWEKLRRLSEFVLDPLMIAPMAIVINLQRNGCP
jgi:hypothetical protein